MRKDWTKIRKIANGHSFWRRNDGEIGIADDSGSFPENCEPADKPPLLLDRSRPILLAERHYSIPVKHEDGSQSVTIAGGFEALWVASEFQLEITAQERDGQFLRARVVDVRAVQP